MFDFAVDVVVILGSLSDSFRGRVFVDWSSLTGYKLLYKFNLVLLRLVRNRHGLASCRCLDSSWGGDLGRRILRVVRLTLLGIVGAHDGRQVGFGSSGLTRCHIALVLLILELVVVVSSDKLLNVQVLSATCLHLLQLLHELRGVGILVLSLLILDPSSKDVLVLLEELLDKILLHILVFRSVFIRIMSIGFLSRCLGVGGIINGSVLGRNR